MDIYSCRACYGSCGVLASRLMLLLYWVCFCLCMFCLFFPLWAGHLVRNWLLLLFLLLLLFWSAADHIMLIRTQRITSQEHENGLSKTLDQCQTARRLCTAWCDWISPHGEHLSTPVYCSLCKIRISGLLSMLLTNGEARREVCKSVTYDSFAKTTTRTFCPGGEGHKMKGVGSLRVISHNLPRCVCVCVCVCVY